MNFLVMVKSCWKHKPRRDAVRATWWQDLDWADGVFIVGEHLPVKPFASKCENVHGEPDLWILPVDDAFKHIGEKLRIAMRKATEKEYDGIVVVDDDTYIRPERMKEFVLTNKDADYVGFTRYAPIGTSTYMQGSCFYVSAKAAAVLAESPALTHGFPDDPPCGFALNIPGILWRNTNRFCVGPNRYAVPDPDNDIVSTHKCLPADMLAVHAQWEREMLHYGM